MLRGIPAGVSSWDSGVAHGGASTVDLSATTTGTRDIVRLPGRATELPHKGDSDSGAAIIADIGQETMDNAEDAANDSAKVARVVSATRATVFLGVALGPPQSCQGKQPHF